MFFELQIKIFIHYECRFGFFEIIGFPLYNYITYSKYFIFASFDSRCCGFPEYRGR